MLEVGILEKMEALAPIRGKREISLAQLADAVDQIRAEEIVVEVPVEHVFTPGLYVRTVRVPANTKVITMFHKVEHPFIISAGKIMVWDNQGMTRVLEAPYVGVTKPGTIRMAITLTDVVWTTCHVTNETNLEKIEADVVMSPREAANQLEEHKWPLLQ